MYKAHVTKRFIAAIGLFAAIFAQALIERGMSKTEFMVIWFITGVGVCVFTFWHDEIDENR